jgi:hypothetical protein
MSNKFPNISTAELEEGIFMGTQIREFLESLIYLERSGWESLKWVCSDFLGRMKSPDFSDGIQTLTNMYKEMGFSLVNLGAFLRSLFDFFPENLGEVSDKQGEHFHQDFNSTEHNCPGFWKDSVLADIVPGCNRHSAPQKEDIRILTFAFSTTNHLVCTELCFMSWKCAYVSDLIQFFENQSLCCPVINTRARGNLKKSS